MNQPVQSHRLHGGRPVQRRHTFGRKMSLADREPTSPPPPKVLGCPVGS